jgi:tetratricopeptide (TPR) repeat protein
VSRSEHSTRRGSREGGDPVRKRRIKQLVAEERARPRDLPQRTPDAAAAGVPIVVRDRDPRLHYLASPDDLRAILERVPYGTAEGLGEIALCIPAPAEDSETLDPLGRPAHAALPGVFSGRVLGTYFSGSVTEIALYGYIYDLALPHRAVVAAYLRLRMLSTFVHELGHHVDRRERVARGRWRFDGDDRELHAQAIERAWTLDYVIPYLEEVHAASHAALERWLFEHTGVHLPIETLTGTVAGAPDTGEAQFFSVSLAFESLYESVCKGDAPPAPQLEFARDLHYGTWYEEALAVLDAVARTHPDDDRQRTLRGDIYVHLGRHADAGALVEPVLARHPDDTDALEVLADVAESAGHWGRVRELQLRRRDLLADDWRMRGAGRDALRAAIELAAWDDVDRELPELRAACRSDRERNRVAELEALAHLRRGRPEQALALVLPIVRARLADAVAIEAGHALGRAVRHERIEGAVGWLRDRGAHAWASRLSAIGGPV